MTILDDVDDQITIDPNKDYLADLVGDGKKFKSPEDLAKGKFYADQTIEVMKRRMDELREEYKKEREQNLTRAQLEEVLKGFQQAPASNALPLVNEDTKPVFDPAQLDSLVANKYQELKEKEKQEANYSVVKAKLTEKYGSNYKDVLSKQMEDLGLSADEVDTMARRNPTVFIKAFGLDQKPSDSYQPPVRSSTQGFAPTSGKKRTWAWYQELKKNQPKVYHDPKTNQQMMADYAELKDDFEDGNFHQYN